MATKADRVVSKGSCCGIAVPPAPAVSPAPKAPRWSYAVGALLQCCLLGGAVFGFFGLVPALVEEGVYADACEEADGEDGGGVCDARSLRIGLLYTVAAGCALISPPVIGAFLDAKGPRLTALAAVATHGTGLMLLCVSLSAGVDIYLPAFALIGASAPSFLFLVFSVANLFPGREGMFVSVVNGAYDLSVLVYPTLNSIRVAADASLVAVLLVYAGVILSLVTAFAVVLWPERPFISDAEREVAEQGALDDKVATDVEIDEETAQAEDAAEVVPSEATGTEDQAGEASSDGSESPDTVANPIAAEDSEAGGAASGAAADSEEASADGVVAYDRANGDVGEDPEASSGQLPPSSPSVPIDEEDVAGDEPRDTEDAAATGAEEVAVDVGSVVDEDADAAVAEPESTVSPKKARFKPEASFIASAPLARLPYSQQWRTFEYWGFVLFFGVLLLQFNWFFGSSNAYLASLGDDGSALDTMSVILPFCAVTVVFMGHITDAMGIIEALRGVGVVALIFALLHSIPDLTAQIVGFVAFGIFRAFIFSSLAAYMSMTFGTRNSGKLLGVCSCICATFSLCWYGLFALTLDTFDGDFLPVNLLLLGLTLAAMAFPVAAARIGRYPDMRSYR